MPHRFSVLLLLFAVAFCLTGCPRTQTTGTEASAPDIRRDRSAGAFAQTDPWLLTTNDREANRGNHDIFLGNGYLGATFGPTGGASENSVCYVAGLYHNEVLQPFPRWNRIALDGDAARGDYQQTLDLRRGVLTTRSGKSTVTVFLARDNPHLAVIRAENVPAEQPGLEAPSGVAAARTSGESGTQTAPGLPTRAFLLHETTFGDGTPRAVIGVAELYDSGTRTFVRLVSVFTERDTKDPKTAAEAALRAAVKAGYDTLRRRHEAAWATLWRRDIVIEGDPEAQQLVHSLMFNLLASTRPGGADSIPPETWSGGFYKGHIFWDAEIWMFPALLAQHPDLARCLLDYRFARLPAARQQARAKGFAGADFPWESAATGREVAPGSFSQGRHVTAGVGWAHWQYWRATGDRTWLRDRGWPVISAVADFWASRARRNAATGKYAINDVFGPDELKGEVDNNTYTNALARDCLLAAGEAAKALGKPAPVRWRTVADNLVFPFDTAHDRYLARENDDGAKTKQADGELVLYPAALPMSPQTARNTFAFHALRPITNGPAMTASIHALLAARLGRADEAERYFRDTYRPFVRGPFLQFSEKRSLDRCYFATAAGGTLQSVLYGFGGLDWDNWERSGGGPAPALPASWKRLTITGIQRDGRSYTLDVTPQSRTLTPE